MGSSDNIIYNIDSFSYDKDKKEAYVSGWVFSKKENEIGITSEGAELKDIKREIRFDVYSHFEEKYRSANDSGFKLVVSASPKQTFSVVFSDGEEKKKVSLNVGEISGVLSLKDRIKITLSFINFSSFKRLIGYSRKNGLKKTFEKIRSLIGSDMENKDDKNLYEKWINKNEKYDTRKVSEDIKGFEYKPLISILVPVYNVDLKWLRRCVDSVRAQYYENWELCLADDKSTREDIKPAILEYTHADSRIKAVFREENGHISKATNSALSLAGGEYIALLDNDDELPPFALYEIVKEINLHPDADLIYSDEDKIDTEGNRTDPHFKPDFSPHTLLSSNYISHLGVYRKAIVDEIGGFRTGYEGSQDYDLVLRFTEKTDNICHIPKILYHWRVVPGSTALGGGEKSYAYVAGKKALEDAVKRRGYSAEVNYIENIQYYDLVFRPSEYDFVSIIIPTKDRADMLERCINSIYEKTKGIGYEIIVVDNNSSEEETFRLFEKYENERDNFSVIKLPIPFNFSKINNEAAKLAKGNLILFLNNDTEVITSDWLYRMAGYAVREEVGCVGAKLFYPNDTIQHAGVLLGVGGVANHAGLNAAKNDNGYFARYSIAYNYSAVTAACLMIRKELFERVGGFEEKLKVAFNDIDFCLRVLNEDKYNVYLPLAQLYHYESVSRGKENSPEKMKRFMSEIKYMRDNWGDVLDNDRFYNKNFSRGEEMFKLDV